MGLLLCTLPLGLAVFSWTDAVGSTLETAVHYTKPLRRFRSPRDPNELLLSCTFAVTTAAYIVQSVDDVEVRGREVLGCPARSLSIVESERAGTTSLLRGYSSHSSGAAACGNHTCTHAEIIQATRRIGTLSYIYALCTTNNLAEKKQQDASCVNQLFRLSVC